MATHLPILAVLAVLLPVKEPVRDLVLTRVLHDGDHPLYLLLCQLTSTLAHVNVSFLQDKIGKSPPNALCEAHVHTFTHNIERCPLQLLFSVQPYM